MTPVGFAGRVCGVATAIGAGVVIGLAVASPASADDTGARDSGSRASSAEHSRGPSAADATTRRASAPSGRSAQSGQSRPAAVLPAPRVVRPASAVKAHAFTAAPAVVNPSPSVTPAAPSPAAAQPAPAPAAADPAPQSLFFDSRGRRITVFKGVHFVTPQSWAFLVKQVSGSGTFTTDSVYDLKDVDQYDWNKFTGIAFSPLQHDRNSVMVGWRYNLTTQQFEIAPFYNVDKRRILPNEQTEVISVPAGETFTYKVDYTGVTISYGDKTVSKPYPPGLTPNIWTSTRVSGWFGGNEVAPRTLTYYLKFR